MKRTTIKDISARLGVNPSTVSRALHDHPDISPALKEEIRKVAAELRYHPNQLAANLRKNRSMLVGLILPEINMFFFPSVIKGMEEVLQEEGYQLMVLLSNESREQEIKNLRICADYLVDGLMISLVAESPDAQHMEEVRELGIPVVLFDKSTPEAGLDEILIDDAEATRECVRYLLSLGCKRIAGMFGHPDMAISQNRLKGFTETIAEAGAVQIPPIFARSFDEARNKSLEWIRVHKPDAFFYMSDETASGLLPALKSQGLRVPEDCKVIGISDGHLPYILDPQLSHYLHDGFEMGRLAARTLLQKMNGGPNKDLVQRKFQKGGLVLLGSA